MILRALTVIPLVLLLVSVAVAEPPASAKTFIGTTTMTTTNSGDIDTTSRALIKNRARTFGDVPSASGTRYVAITDATLSRLTPGQILQKLTPSNVGASDGVRRVEVLVDLQRPLTLIVPKQTPVDIGTVPVAVDVRKLDVNSFLRINRLTLVGK